MNPDREHDRNLLAMGDAARPQAAETISVKDLSEALRDFARVYGNPRTGNPRLAEALNRLSKVLQRYADRDLEEVLDELVVTSHWRQRKKSAQVSHLQGIELASIDLKKAKDLLYTQDLTKMDLIRLAHERFGIARSRLQRQSREAVVDAIDAALRNVEALDIISQEASREGSRRSR